VPLYATVITNAWYVFKALWKAKPCIDAKQVPSCEDFGDKLTKEEKQMSWYIFEFFSILDHSQRAMYDGTNEFFNHVHADMRDFVRKFSYADEQQSIAQMREQHRNMILALIMSITLLTCAAVEVATEAPAVGPAVAAGGIVGLAFAKTAAQVARIDSVVLPIVKWSPIMGKQAESLSPVAGIINSAYIGLQNLAVTFDPVKDTLVHTLAMEQSKNS
jgi:hypothetical protein